MLHNKLATAVALSISLFALTSIAQDPVTMYTGSCRTTHFINGEPYGGEDNICSPSVCTPDGKPATIDVAQKHFSDGCKEEDHTQGSVWQQTASLRLLSGAAIELYCRTTDTSNYAANIDTTCDYYTKTSSN